MNVSSVWAPLDGSSDEELPLLVTNINMKEIPPNSCDVRRPSNVLVISRVLHTEKELRIALYPKLTQSYTHIPKLRGGVRCDSPEQLAAYGHRWGFIDYASSVV
jgi:hypothetical protein